MTLIINPIIQSQTIAINSLGLGLASLPNGATESLMELKYAFEGWPSVSSTISYGDVVVFNTLVPASTNPYGVLLEKADTSNPEHANKSMMVFVSHINGTLILMHKGYIDFTDIDNSLNSYVQGDGLYVNGSNISITPPQTSGSWVKSIGFCMPNIEGVYRIWFESDSTYFTIG